MKNKENWLKGLLNFYKKDSEKNKENIVDLYLDLKEVADKLCEKIDKRISELKEIEKRIDSKIEQYKNLITNTEINKVSRVAYDRRNEVIKLYLKGEDPATIAKSLGIPIGEVEFLINLYKIKTSEK